MSQNQNNIFANCNTVDELDKEMESLISELNEEDGITEMEVQEATEAYETAHTDRLFELTLFTVDVDSDEMAMA